jgi:hypothetical protein
MSLIAGRGARAQVGIESAWGTAVNPTVQVGFVSENIKRMLDYKEEDILTGRKTMGRMDVLGDKVEGDFTIIPHPDTCGELLAAHFGGEAETTAAGSAYVHSFTHVAAGASASLPKFTMEIDRIVRVFKFTSCKSDTLKLAAKVSDYLRMTFTIRGRGEGSSALLSLSDSALKGFKFKQGQCTITGSAFATVTDFNLTDSNNLDNDLYAMDGSELMIEIEPGDRATTIDAELLYDTSAEALRAATFAAGAPCSVVLTFTSDEMVGGTSPYELVITLPNVYFTDIPPMVDGPQRLRVKLTGTATEQNGSEAITVALHNSRATEYLP